MKEVLLWSDYSLLRALFLSRSRRIYLLVGGIIVDYHGRICGVIIVIHNHLCYVGGALCDPGRADAHVNTCLINESTGCRGCVHRDLPFLLLDFLLPRDHRPKLPTIFVLKLSELINFFLGTHIGVREVVGDGQAVDRVTAKGTT